MSVWLVLGLAILCVARDAEAERAIVVDAVDVPFAANDLATAIRVRVAASGARIRIRVTATEGGVQIAAAGGEREVALLGLRGPAAARLVALAANDLLPDDLAIVNALASARAEPGSRTTLGVLGAAASWDGVLGQIALDVTLPRAGWLVALELGGGALVGGSLALTTATARVDAGWRAGVLEARAGLTAAPVFVSKGAGDQTVLVGGNASLRARLPLTATLRGVVAIGCDVFATRTTYLVEGMAALTTPRFAPWLAAGLEVGL